MSSTTSKALPIGLVIVAVLGVATILISHVWPDRMPPDPFEGEDPREVILEVTWQGEEHRTQNIFWEAGEERGSLPAEEGETSDGFGGWHWSHTTIAYSGERLQLSAVQAAPGPVQCALYVDEVQVAVDEATDKAGCVAEAIVA